MEPWACSEQAWRRLPASSLASRVALGRALCVPAPAFLPGLGQGVAGEVASKRDDDWHAVEPRAAPGGSVARSGDVTTAGQRSPNRPRLPSHTPSPLVLTREREVRVVSVSPTGHPKLGGAGSHAQRAAWPGFNPRSG